MLQNEIVASGPDSRLQSLKFFFLCKCPSSSGLKMTSWIRSSLRRKGPQTFGYQDRDPGSESSGRIIAETFERHWHQLRGIAAHNVS